MNTKKHIREVFYNDEKRLWINDFGLISSVSIVKHIP